MEKPTVHSTRNCVHFWLLTHPVQFVSWVRVPFTPGSNSSSNSSTSILLTIWGFTVKGQWKSGMAKPRSFPGFVYMQPDLTCSIFLSLCKMGNNVARVISLCGYKFTTHWTRGRVWAVSQNCSTPLRKTVQTRWISELVYGKAPTIGFPRSFPWSFLGIKKNRSASVCVCVLLFMY